MTNEEIAVKLEGHDHEIGSLKHRMDNAEKVQDEIHGLATTMATMVLTVNHTNENVGELKEKVIALEREPADKWRKASWLVIAAIIGAVIGYFI